MKAKQIEEYEVNSCTMFLEPVEYGSKIYTRIIEVEDEFLAPFKPLDIIKNSCNYFGCDYESRKRGTKLLTGIKRKIPIVIEPTNSLFFFPTTSPNRQECIWIAHDYVENYRRSDRHQTLIKFQNNKSYYFPVSYCTIDGQMGKTSSFKTKLMQRIEKNERKLFYLMNRQRIMNASENSRVYDSN
ncbi:competence protein ComK [Neobacillus ginsengisoli]|uniref:Competence protein ComK n=1 Tax=Neobacillus ginsengisoli TaxID=904295 RepID=A0ABT9XRF8_9BACI|nr:competence protein ComK [Neobacillus ginsengisoli]MDQ0198128.1 competence protein ComK [Neobacillus ginsengisoli]